MTTVRLVGLDFGTTTSSGVIATAELSRNSVTGKQELAGLRETFHSEMIFTPFTERGLDIGALQEHVDHWLAAGGENLEPFFGGGALLTGLAAERSNAQLLMEMIQARLGDALIATAGDPSLESWLAFQASAAALSRANPDRWVVNLDIGGGTTSIAAGQNGEVLRTGSLFVGARHVQLVPGTYQIIGLSPYAQILFDRLRFEKGPGDLLEPSEVAAVIGVQIGLLESAVAGRLKDLSDPAAEPFVQIPFDRPADCRTPIVTVSGGVGELLYAALAGSGWPGTTRFGDLGIELARGLASSRWNGDFERFAPACGGRATVYGLLRNTTQVSGSTLFLTDRAQLPLRNLPIFGCLSADSTDEQIRDILQRVKRNVTGGCVHVVLPRLAAETVAQLGNRIGKIVDRLAIAADQPVVLLMRENVGKAFGQYVTDWGRRPLALIVVDEIDVRDARFVNVGRVRNQAVPVSFYGMN